ncbi:hypothetical protein PYW08_001155 [Mythimna loreyi]|uniref:Uncharacterized protein n=1 Tax=Mythimna loreyi TaxID=667449 RepID=A0ACC2R008_9NEOP|nr:hypothetical protein PYW08_001155 [Mythimna loreyi]
MSVAEFSISFLYLMLFGSSAANLLIFFSALFLIDKQFSEVQDFAKLRVNYKSLSSAGPKDMNLDTMKWSRLQRTLISVVEESPIASLPHKNRTMSNWKMGQIWKDISTKVGLSSRKCKIQWSRIKLSYAKIILLIKNGEVPTEVATSHPETSKYFDGCLNFINPFISDITEEDIPLSIHRYINAIFGIEIKETIEKTNREKKTRLITHEQVKSMLLERKLKGDVVNNINMKHLLSVVEKAVGRKLEELRLMQNAPSNMSNDIANNNDDENTVNLTMIPSENSSSNVENTTTISNLELQTEIILDDDIKIEEEDYIKMEAEDFVNSQEDNFVLLQDEQSVNNQNDEYNDNFINSQNELYIEMQNEDFVNSQNEQYVDLTNEDCVNSLNKQYEDMKEDFVKEHHSTLEKSENNTTETNDDIETSLPSTHILSVAQAKKIMNELNDQHEDMLVIEEDEEEEGAADMTDTPPITNEYIRHFFTELGAIMSVELSLDKQNILKSRIHDLVKREFLKEIYQISEM